MFYMGLFLGLAISSIVALGSVVSLVWSGKSLAAGGTNVVATNPTPSPSPSPSPTPTPAGPVKPVSDKDHILGNKNAKVTLIEYSDFECPFCSRHLPAIKQALKDFPNDVRLVYRHFPLSFHPQATPAAVASECAAKLGGNDKFWTMHDKLFENQTTLGRDLYVRLAKEMGLKEADFTKCLDSDQDVKTRVSTDMMEGESAGVEGTPATFVNGKLVSGAVPYEMLKQEIVAAGASK